jgi:hypothetical protein
MGVCPQFDVLWDELSGREHLTIYGHIKGLKFSEVGCLISERPLFFGGFAAGVKARELWRCSPPLPPHITHHQSPQQQNRSPSTPPTSSRRSS